MSESCPVCYERFDDVIIPRKLACGDMLCTNCVEVDFIGGSFFCPECGQELKGASLDEFSTVKVLSVPEEEKNESAKNHQTAAKPRSQTLADFTKSNPSYSPIIDSKKTRTSSMECLNHANLTSPRSPGKTARSGRLSDPFRFGECKETNCNFKACAADGFCLKHSAKKKHTVVEESRIATALANTPLDFVTLKGTSLELKHKTHIWPEVIPENLEERLRNQEHLEMGEAMDLIDRAKAIISREPNVLRLEAPVMAVGDIHGQFYDLMNIWEVGGKPGSGGMYLFLGDYVDRGSFSCEVILTLLAYKVTYPDRVWLIRGNHECASVSGHFGFKEECKMKYGVQVYYRFLLLFQTLPLAAVVSTAYGDLFACHGGLSPNAILIEDIEKIDRFVEPEENQTLLDILWSDPVNEDRVAEMTDEEYTEFISIDWRPNPSRGCSYCYGYRAVNDFLCQNNLVTIVRAHEVQELGYHKHFDPAYIEERMRHAKSAPRYRRRLARRSSAETIDNDTHTEKMIASNRPFRFHDSGAVSESTLDCPSSPDCEDEGLSGGELWYHPSDDIPTVITVFSAPNYCDRYANKGAILRIDMALDGFKVLQYDCVEHPKPEITESQMNNHILAVIAICPYMPTSFRDFVRLALELGPEDNLLDDNEEMEVEDPQPALQHSDSSFSFGSPEPVNRAMHSTSISDADDIDSPAERHAQVCFDLSTSVEESTGGTKNDPDAECGKSTEVETPQAPAPPLNSSVGKLFPSIDTRPILKSSMSAPNPGEVNTDFSTSDVLHRNSLRQGVVDATDVPVFSPQQVKRRSSSIKKERRAIALVSRESHYEDMHRARCHSEDVVKVMSRRCSTNPRLEGNATTENFYLNRAKTASVDLSSHLSPPKSSMHFSPFDRVGEHPSNAAGRASRGPTRASISMGYFSRYNAHVLRSNTYTQAHASDAINELHPNQLARVMENFQRRAHTFQLAEEEKPITPFSEIKKRFESCRNLRGSEDEGDEDIDFPRSSRISFARLELQEFKEEVRRGRTQTVSSLRAKFDKRAKENAERALKDSRVKFRRRSASLQPLTQCDLNNMLVEESPDQPTRTRGRRSSVSDAELRCHSLSPVPSSKATFFGSPEVEGHGEESLSTLRPRPRGGASQLSTTMGHPSHKNSTQANTHTPEEAIGGRPSQADDDFWFIEKYQPHSEKKLLALRLMFSLFDRSGSSMIGYEDLVAYGEETGGLSGIRDAAEALEIVDIDGDGKIGLLDFIHFAARLQLMFQQNLMKRVLDELIATVRATVQDSD